MSPAGPDSGDHAFADLLNGLTLDGARRRTREESRPDRAPAPEHPPTQPEPTAEESADLVRAYAWTAGRTHPAARLEVETLVSTADIPPPLPARLPAEHHTVVELCRSTRSVAEVAALLSLPLGVAKVLVGDLAERGLVVVHEMDAGGAAPDLGLMERVLSGLRGL
ncbi:DUF742 domain-containing protein [Actinokineospora sp. 24-640]